MTKTGMETSLDIVLDAATVSERDETDEEDSESLTPGTAAVTGSGLPLLFSILFIKNINSRLFPEEYS